MVLPPSSRSLARRREISRLSREAKSLQDELESLAAAGRHGRLYREGLAYLNRTDMRDWAAIRTLSDEAGDSAVNRLSAQADPFTAKNGIVPFEWQAKNSGRGFRPICSPPPALAACSYLIKDVLEARFQPERHIYDIKGRGRDAAIGAVKEALEAGYSHCFIGDVRDCYQSVRMDNLYNLLPLPRLVIGHCLDYRNLTFREKGVRHSCVYSHGSVGRRWNGPQGLLQGLPSSSIILATLFNSLAAQIAPHDCHAVLYGDNLFLAAQDGQTLSAIIALCREYFEEHPAGPFDLRNHPGCVEPEDGFNFLSYFVAARGSRITIHMSHRAWSDMEDAIDIAVQEDIARGDGNPRSSEQVIRDHFSGFREIDNWCFEMEVRVSEAAHEIEDAYYDRFINFDFMRKIGLPA
ncbi:reverse transcriptase domain-containing protein [Croceicoccus ponticola]|nr:reverse transcriptase domain-containing protein [Croceicoccus ponticola]